MRVMCQIYEPVRFVSGFEWNIEDRIIEWENGV
jgi:hypothetical protein